MYCTPDNFEAVQALVERHMTLNGTVLDLPHAGAGARQRITQAGLAARCAFQGGSFFDPLPAGADVYLLKSILHNWNDEACARILQRWKATGATAAASDAAPRAISPLHPRPHAGPRSG